MCATAAVAQNFSPAGGAILRVHLPAVWVLLLVLVAPSLLAGCGGKTIGASLDDATITARVKTALLNDPQVGAKKIDVSTENGVVTISGAVKTKAEEARAIDLARQV